MLEIRGSRVGGKAWWMARRRKGSREEVPAREEQTEAQSRCGKGGIGGSGTYLSAAKENAGSQGRNVSVGQTERQFGKELECRAGWTGCDSWQRSRGRFSSRGTM